MTGTEKTFYLYMKQKGEGCDYTIGCAQKLVRLDAETLQDAIEEVKDVWFNPDDRRYGRGDYELSEALVLTLAKDALPILHDMLVEEEAQEELEKKQRAEAQERAEYERLKNKFGK